MCNSASPNVCATTCGDGYKRGSEACDDGDTSNSDGCSAACTVETGYSCTGSETSGCNTVCGDNIVAGSEQCDAVSLPSTTCNIDCTSTSCGDGILNTATGEQCDSGVLNSNTAANACRTNCLSARCGDNVIDSGETCEPPGVGSCGMGCTLVIGIGGGSTQVDEDDSSVKRTGPPPSCGNGVMETGKGEQCDLGLYNGISPSCSRWCEQEYCGDGVLKRGEQCEPIQDENGVFVAGTCGKVCTVPVCLNGECSGGCKVRFLPACPEGQPEAVFEETQSIEGTESDSNGTAQEAADLQTSDILKLPFNLQKLFPHEFTQPTEPQEMLSEIFFGWGTCGDGKRDIKEDCDDGNVQDGDGCSASCLYEQSSLGLCGDGVPEAEEECDQGIFNSNSQPNACRNNCRIAYCGDGVRDTGEQCDDGNTILGDGCTSTCVISQCSNGLLELGEECDDGKQNSDTLPNHCSTRCLMPHCGDGLVDPAFGELCDDGLLNTDYIPDRCRQNCIPSHCGDGVKDEREECDDGAQNGGKGAQCSHRCTILRCEDGTQPEEEGCSTLTHRAASQEQCDAVCTLGAWWHAVLKFLAGEK